MELDASMAEQSGMDGEPGLGSLASPSGLDGPEGRDANIPALSDLVSAGPLLAWSPRSATPASS